MSQRVVSLSGDPGAGKTLFCRLLAEEFGVQWLSISHELSFRCVSDDDYSRRVNLVPDKKVLDIVRRFIDEHGSQAASLAIDGFPRTMKQAEALASWSVSYTWDLDVYYLTYSHMSMTKAWECIRRRTVCSACGRTTLQDLSDIPRPCPKCGAGVCMPRDESFPIFKKRVQASRSFLEDLRKSDLIVRVQKVNPCYTQIVKQLARQYAVRLQNSIHNHKRYALT